MSAKAASVLQVIQPESRGSKTDMCIEPGEALQQELGQSQALALLTAVELLQSMCKEDSDAGQLSGIGGTETNVILVTSKSRGKS